MIEFHGSSLCLKAAKLQSKLANKAPHTAKFPPTTGPRAFTASRLPLKLFDQPFGLLRKPLTLCQIDPPTAPMLKAPPMSSSMRAGHGSRPENSPMSWGAQSETSDN